VLALLMQQLALAQGPLEQVRQLERALLQERVAG
jgi:hypothetical protein